VNRKQLREKLCGVWSATPTPFTEKMKVDKVAVRRMVEHQVKLGLNGLFLAGTTGEGPWLSNAQRRDLVRSTVKFARGKLVLAVQVTDNSSQRILENIHAAKEDGADIAVIAEPYMMLKPKPAHILNTYVDAIRKSSLPVGIYDRGAAATVPVPESILPSIYARDNVVLIKDSSANPRRRKIALAARRKRPGLRLLNGDEFCCVEPLMAGYNGLLLGGGVFNAYLAGRILKAVEAGDIDEAQRSQQRMNRMMLLVYGKDRIRWVAGTKELLVGMKVFRTARHCLGHQLTDRDRRRIARVLRTEADILFPWKARHDT